MDAGIRPQYQNQKLQPKFRGCLLGGAVGDALGAPVEFLTLAQIREQFGQEGIKDYALAFGRLGAVTDDTQMTLFTAEGLLRGYVRGCSKGISSLPGVTAHAYLRWLLTQGVKHPKLTRSEPDGWLFSHPELHHRRAPGNTCLSALGEMKAFGEHASNNSKGCGGVMRVAPVAMYAAHHIGETGIRAFRIALEIAAITHGHRTGQLAAGAFAMILTELFLGSVLEVAILRAREELTEYPGHEETLQAINKVIKLNRKAPKNPEDLETLGSGWTAEEALAISLYCALGAKDFASGVLLAVNHSGDSDSTGSMTGNLLGAQFGVEGIPGNWLDKLELRGVIEEVADDLATFPQWRVGDYDAPEHEAEDRYYWNRYPGY